VEIDALDVPGVPDAPTAKSSLKEPPKNQPSLPHPSNFPNIFFMFYNIFFNQISPPLLP
jgi:hypothetical protein